MRLASSILNDLSSFSSDAPSPIPGWGMAHPAALGHERRNSHASTFTQQRKELWWNLGDAVDQAAFCAGVLMTSTPLVNLIPWTTLGNWFSPFSRRQVFAAAVTSLNTISLAVS